MTGYALKAAMIAGAKRPVTGTADEIGEGGADYFQFITGSWTQFWNGNNNYFENQDLASDGVDDGWITVYRHLSSAADEARIVLSCKMKGIIRSLVSREFLAIRSAS